MVTLKTKIWKLQRGKKTFILNYFLAIATLLAYLDGLMPFWAFLLMEGTWINYIVDRHTKKDDERLQRILNEI